MKVQFTDYQGTERKPLVKAIEEIANRKGTYCMNGGMKYAYDFGGGLELHRDGMLKADGCIGDADNSDLLAQLHLKGFSGTVLDRGEEPAENAEEAAAADEYDGGEQATEQPKKRKGIMDCLVEALNETAAEGEHWERMHRTPTIIDNSGREHNLDGTFASTAAYGDLKMDEREELGLGRKRRDHPCEDGMQASDVPDTITIELPATNVKEDILRALLQSKATLITAALGEDAYWYAPEEEHSPENPGGWHGPAPAENILPIEFADGKIKFEWLRFGADADTVTAWSTFLAAACKFCKTAKRVTAKDTAVENEKFAFRTFMVKIGMNDAENKWARKRLLQNLTGDSAFATLESKERWLAKHGKKTTKEAKANEAAE